MAVNCLESEARRKLVCGVMGRAESTSARPYEARTMTESFRTTSTLAPGIPDALKGMKRESIIALSSRVRDGGDVHAASNASATGARTVNNGLLTGDASRTLVG